MTTSTRIVHTSAPLWPKISRARFASGIRQDSPQGCAIALLGLPDDTGVRLNFGREGARLGPQAFRAALAGFGSSFDGTRQRALEVPVFDAGDVIVEPGGGEAALYETHARVEAAARELHELGLVVVGIGGGHDLTLPALTALSRKHGSALGGVNFDAHLDVRERVGSGMAFRRLIEGKWLDPPRFATLGLGRFANERGDFEWLLSQGARLVMAESVLAGQASPQSILNQALSQGPGFVSIDLDGLDAALAPGVSAPSPLGLGVRDATALAEAAGASPGVRHFDLMELSPPHDVAERTARIAALLFLSFVAGFAERGPG